MSFEEFWQTIANFGEEGRRIPGKPHYFYKLVLDGNEEKLFFSSDNARRPFSVSKEKSREKVERLNNPDGGIGIFVRDNGWFCAVYEDVRSLLEISG
jgi:hypothetical protein